MSLVSSSVLLGVVVYHWIVVVYYYNRHNCVLLDGIVEAVCYYLISMETTISVGDDCQLDG